MRFLYFVCVVAAVSFLCCRVAHAAPSVGHAGAGRTHHSSYIVPATGSTVNWPQSGFDSGHSGYNPKENLISASNVATLQQAWSFSPVAMAGNLVFADGMLFASSEDGTLYALNAATGAATWTFATGQVSHVPSGSPPAVDDGLVFTVCSQGSTEGLCAVKASTGSLQWYHETVGSAPYIASPPAFYNGYVYVQQCPEA